MALLSEKDNKFLQGHLAEHMVNPVKLLFFTQTVACQFCRETEAILREVAGLSDKITVEVFDFVTNADIAAQYGIDKIPATVVIGDTDYGVRFYGIPSGYEFTSLVETIIMVSRGKSKLSDETLKALADITEPVHIQVLVTPTCPYCPAAVQLAHALAVASDKVRADMVEAIEFPHLAHKYEVQGVPRIIINETVAIEGAAPEPLLLARILQAVGLRSKEEVDELFADAAKPAP
ncbi:MAG: thioredoxin family protein [Chloroflexi bacterium]|nr:thioredoxin family protein [Chloroflexota bacterium]